MVLKFEQNRMAQTARNFKLFDKKKKKKKTGFFKTICLKSVDAILEDVSVAETIVLR